MFILLSVAVGYGQEANALALADYEVDELFEGRDQYNNAIGHAPWGDIAGNVVLSLAEMERVDASSTVLAIDYDIGAWGGFTHALTDGESWTSQDWTPYNAVRFWLYGNNTGGNVQVEIFDNRNPNLTGDSAERWYYRIADDYQGWLEFTIEFRSFQRRTDWQPGGAPDDGLGLDAVSGLAFGFPAGTGAQTAYLDDVQLVTLDVEPLMLDDFETAELFIGEDGDGNDIGFVTWGDAPGNVELSLFTAIRGGQESTALNMNFDIAGWGGFTHVLNDGENWISMDWRDYNAISFAFLGNNTGGAFQFEIFDNRNPELTGDSAERWFYRFDDDAYGWRVIEIPFIDFQRRSDWQPSGAPDDGFGLDAVSGYAFGLPAGIGSAFAIIDDVQLVSLPGVASPEATSVEEAEAAPEPVALEEVALNEALLEPIPYADPMLVADYEDGLHYVSQADGAAIGFVAWGDATANAIIGTSQIMPFTALALPDASAPNQVLRVDYNIGAWGGFTHAFSDGVGWQSMDWTGHNALQFWLYGNNTGRAIQVEIFDNRQMDSNADSAERFFYHLLDDYEGWRQITVPFAFFQRRADWQPGGAPDDGFNLDAVWGYAFGFPAGVDAQTAYLDDLMIVVVDDPSQVRIGGATW